MPVKPAPSRMLDKNQFNVFVDQLGSQVQIVAKLLPVKSASVMIFDRKGALLHTYMIGAQATIQTIMPTGLYQVKLVMPGWRPTTRKLLVR